MGPFSNVDGSWTAICSTDALTPRQFAEMTDLDYELVCLVYAAYAADGRRVRKDRWAAWMTIQFR